MQTRWRVVTGPPSSGKTSVILRLEALGHRVRPEAATLYIEQQLKATGRLLADLCAPHNQPTLQAGIAALNAALEAEIAHEPNVPHILDRSVVDGLAYCRFYGHDDGPTRAHMLRRYHPTVILLDRLPWQPNHVRCENETMAAALDALYEEVYRDLGYTVRRVPVPVHPDPSAPADEQAAWSVDERVKLILGIWNET
jgi:predicted ATPase